MSLPTFIAILFSSSIQVFVTTFLLDCQQSAEGPIARVAVNDARSAALFTAKTLGSGGDANILERLGFLPFFLLQFRC